MVGLQEGLCLEYPQKVSWRASYMVAVLVYLRVTIISGIHRKSEQQIRQPSHIYTLIATSARGMRTGIGGMGGSERHLC